MKKRRYVLFGLLGLLALTSCGSNIDYKESILCEAKTLSYSNDYSENSAAFELETNKLNNFSAKLTENIVKDNNSNIAISPLSIYMALAMTSRVSNGDTKQEILDLFNMSDDEIKGYTKSLYYYSQRNKKNDNNVNILKEILTNSIWLDNDFTPKGEVLEDLANNFGTDSFRVDFDDENKKANEAIREYVKDKTCKLIDQDFKITEDTLFSLINTLYFKDAWDFDNEGLKLTSRKYSFNKEDGSSINDYFLMSTYNAGKAIYYNNFSTFHTQTEDDFKIHFVLPNDGYNLSQVFNEETINFVTSADYDLALSNSKIEDESFNYTRCIFPKFQASYNGDIKQNLIVLGVKQAFGYNADFTAITDEKVYIDSVIHATKFKADKKGMEGAAVTITALKSTATSPDRKIFYDYVIDKPFGFVVTDSNNVPVFTGIIHNI